MAVRQPQVFISYQRTDEVFARQVREHLVIHGIRTWMDQYDIAVGAYWPDEIDKGLAGSDIVVGILSPDSAESRNVKNEWDWALQRNTPLLLLMARPTEIPHRYVSINFIDATTEQRRALDLLLHALGVETSAAPAGTLPVLTHHGARRVTRLFPAPPSLVGREREQAQLTALLDRMTAGSGALVLVGGEAGIGKTTLTNWLLWAAEERGALARVGGCYDLTTTPPYGPWGEILRGWPGAAAGVPEVPNELREGTGMGNIQSQVAFFTLAGNFLVEAATVRPLVLVLEDLHWSDLASLDFLRYAARLVADVPLLLVCTWREDELTRRHPLAATLPILARERHARRLLLARLDSEAIAELVANHYALPTADATRLSAFVERLTEGNPFFASEVLRAVEEAGGLRRDGDAWQLARLEQIQVPALVRQVVESRLARLSDDARRLLEVAAVIGHDVPLDLWVEASGADDAALSDALERATEGRLVEELSDRASFRFTHALVRETLYEGVVSLRLRAWHRKVADALIGQPRPTPDRVAHHLQQAGDARAFDWLVRAGEQARMRYAWIDAVDRYDRAVALIADDEARAQTRGWLLYRIGVLLRVSNPRRGIPYMEDALEIGHATGDRTLEAYATFLHGLLHCLSGELQIGIPRMDEGAALADRLTEADLERSGPLLVSPYAEVERIEPEWRSEYLRLNPVRGTVIQELPIAGRNRDALAQGEAFVALAQGRTLPPPLVHQVADAYFALCSANGVLGNIAASNRSFELAAEAYRSIGLAVLLRTLAWLRFAMTHWRCNPEDALERAYLQGILAETDQRAMSAFGEVGDYRLTSFIDDVFADRWDAIVALAPQLLGQSAQPRFLVRRMLVQIALARGEREVTREGIVGEIPLQPDDPIHIGNLLNDAELAALAAIVYLDDDDLDSAKPWLRAYDTWLRRSEAVLGRSEGALLWARYHAVAGDRPAAREHAERAIVHASDPRQPFALLHAHRFLGELLIELGELDAAAEHLRASLAVAEAIGIRSEIAWTRLAQAELQAARGEVDAARTLLAEVRAVFEPLGAVPTLERIAALEQRVAGTGASSVAGW